VSSFFRKKGGWLGRWSWRGERKRQAALSLKKMLHINDVYEKRGRSYDPEKKKERREKFSFEEEKRKHLFQKRVDLFTRSKNALFDSREKKKRRPGFPFPQKRNRASP